MPEPPPAASERAPHPERPARVLLVEDEEDVRFVLARMLRKIGYEVVEADDGPAAITVLETMSIDALVTDVVLPTLGGEAVAEACRRLHPAAAQVFMTGFAGQELAQRGLPDGVTLLEKPFPPGDLARALAKRMMSDS